MIYRLVCAFIIISLSTFMPFLASANETSSRNPNFFDTPDTCNGWFCYKDFKEPDSLQNNKDKSGRFHPRNSKHSLMKRYPGHNKPLMMKIGCSRISRCRVSPCAEPKLSRKRGQQRYSNIRSLMRSYSDLLQRPPQISKSLPNGKIEEKPSHKCVTRWA